LYLFGFAGGAAVWLASIAIPGPERHWLWAAALALELAMPVLGWRAMAAAPINAPHVIERFGLFFIIVLGESVVAVVAGIAGTHFSAAAARGRRVVVVARPRVCRSSRLLSARGRAGGWRRGPVAGRVRRDPGGGGRPAARARARHLSRRRGERVDASGPGRHARAGGP